MGRFRALAPRALRGADVIFRKRFGDVIARQLDLFEQDNADLLERIADARESYEEASLYYA